MVLSLAQSQLLLEVTQEMAKINIYCCYELQSVSMKISDQDMKQVTLLVQHDVVIVAITNTKYISTQIKHL